MWYNYYISVNEIEFANLRGDYMEYVTKKCPNCGHAYTVLHPGSNTSYDSPVVRCEKCGQYFVDKDRIELALTDETSASVPRHSGSTYLQLFVLTFAEIALIYLQFDGTLGEYWWLLIVISVLYLGVWFLFISERTSYPERVAEFEKERLRSEARLSNPEYAALLKKLSYDVPEKYLSKQNANTDVKSPDGDSR